MDNLPDICGPEDRFAKTMAQRGPLFLPESDIDFENIKSGFSIALHMHQPLIPAGGEHLQTARVISNLKYMMDHPQVGDNHNAPTFLWCYKRMGELIPQLVHEGKNPRVMLDYSGCLLHGLRLMGFDDVLDSMRIITCEPSLRRSVEWLGSAWGHPVAPSTPVQDYRLHIRAWQHDFAAIFGSEALGRVRGFSLAEMALPNHPDVCYEFVRTLKDCRYEWLLVQEHTVERTDGTPIQTPHVPHRLVARNSRSDCASIVAIVKTQGSDTKLVGQMQPFYEAKGLSRGQLAGRSMPLLVTQIADGENGGVMMNEFPGRYLDVTAEASGSQTPPVNVSEYLEYLASLGLTEERFPVAQPVMQSRLWERMEAGAGPAELAVAIEELQKQDHQFHMEGGSWTSDRSWVDGYEHVLGPMESASVRFAEKALAAGISPGEPRYRNALYHLLMTQTSCFRYWGEGRWTDYGRELCRRTQEILTDEF